MKVKIDYMTGDRICRKTLLKSIELLSREIKELRKKAEKAELQDFQRADLTDARNWIHHLKATYEYYTTDFSVLDKFES